MSGTVRVAGRNDLDLLADLMGEFYAEWDTPFDREAATAAFTQLMAHPSLGMAWILQDEDQDAGYVVLALGFGMEHFGRNAFVDDLFVRPGSRGKGLGRAAMEAVFSECRRRSVRAVHLEVAHDNVRAKELYAKFGFRDQDRELLTCVLEDDPG